MSPARLFLPAILAGTALGILAQDGGSLEDGSIGPAFATGTACLVVGSLLRRGVPILAGVLVLAAALGAWRGAAAALPTGADSVSALVGEERRWIAGRVVEEPRARAERQQVVLEELQVGTDPGQTSPTRGRLLVWLPRAIVVTSGDRIALDARLEAPRDFDGFAYREYLARQGVGAVASAYHATVTPADAGAPREALAGLRAALLRGLNATVPEPEAALGAGILLGVRASIAPDVADAFAVAGLTHVVAISGWNIAIVVAVVTGLTRPLIRLPAGRLLAVGLAAGTVLGYVLLTGASPSVVRAALMAGALVLARLGGSRAHALGALMVAALAMLLASPALLWDVGFQLSALATAGLIWFGTGLERLLTRWPALVREPVALTVAAQLTTLPVILLNFERLSLVAPAANVLVVPLVPLVMLCSALASVLGALVEALGTPAFADALVWAIGGAAWLYLRLMIAAGQAAASVPLASVDLAAPAWLGLAWYPLLAVVHRRLPSSTPGAGTLPASGTVRLVRPVPVAMASVGLLGVLTLASAPDGRLRLVMLDVGQGDAILVRAPSGATALIDGGPDPDLAARRLGEVLPFWQRDLDAVILTHPHEDHVAGLVPALERYRVGLIMEPGRDYENPTYPRFLALASSEPGAEFRLARAGQRLALDPSTTLTVLFPGHEDAAAPLPEGDINNASVVAMLEHGSFHALLTGDAEAPVEELLLSRGAVGAVDVLKVGHHGSDSSTGPRLLKVTRPRYALVSAGRDNEYGHPHGSTLDHLAAVPGITVLRTDRHGTVELVVDGEGIGVHPHGPADAGSIGPWPYRPAIAPRRSWRGTGCRTGSCSTRVAWPGWRSSRRGPWRTAACRSTRAWSRSPPCCTTSTSRRPVAPVRMGWSPPAG